MPKSGESSDKTTMETRVSDAELVKGCLNGKSSAWEELVRRYSRRVYNITYQFTGRHEEAEDLTQEIFLKLYKSLATFDQTAEFLPWLIRVSKNLCVDHYRRRRRERLLTHGNWEALSRARCTRADPYQKTFIRERRTILMRSLEEMPDELKEVVILRDLQGMSYQEVSEALGLPEGTVKSRLNRGRLELAKRIRKHDLSLERVGQVRGGWFRMAVREPLKAEEEIPGSDTSSPA